MDLNMAGYGTLREIRGWFFEEASSLRDMVVDHSYLEALILFGGADSIILVGMGKCGHVAKKVVATFTSVGVSAKFMHPVEAMHGDLGMVGGGDVFLIFSNSGETDEIVSLLPHLHGKVIAVTGDTGSKLASVADVVIDIGGCPEIDDYGIVPTTSTTCMTAVGDVLAVSLMKLNGFTDKDFVANHSGGSIGKGLK